MAGVTFFTLLALLALLLLLLATVDTGFVPAGGILLLTFLLMLLFGTGL